MANNIKNLTEVLCDDTFDTEISAGCVALENKAYTQAWNHFYKMYESKKISETQRGEASYYLHEVMKQIPNDDELIKKLMKSDPGLLKKAQSESISYEFARRYLGRKYLENSAQYEYEQGMIEYGLSCVDCAAERGFPYKYNEENAETGVAWANKMLRMEAKKSAAKVNKKMKCAAYIILAKYYFVQRTNECAEGKRADQETTSVKEFGHNVLKAEAQGVDDAYVNFFSGHLYSNPVFKGFERGKHYDLEKGLELFEKAELFSDDPWIKASAKNFIELTKKQMNLRR